METDEINEILSKLYDQYINKEIGLSEIFNIAKIKGISDVTIISDWLKDKKCS